MPNSLVITSVILLPRLDVMDSNYTTLYRIADDVVFHVHVPRTPAAGTVSRHLDSSFVIFPDYDVVGIKKPFTCRRKRSSFTTSASATYFNSDDADAAIFCIFENQLITPPLASLICLKPNAECLGKWRNRLPPIPTVLCTTPAFHRR